jgi:hypothetical protein
MAKEKPHDGKVQCRIMPTLAASATHQKDSESFIAHGHSGN